MGLPKELIDYIMDMLCDDGPALKACSLTCKAMFASTRRLLHQTLRLPALHIPTRAKKSFPQKSNPSDAELRVLTYRTERGLLQHTRRVHISLIGYYIQHTAPFHLHRFQSLDRVHTLSIAVYDTVIWAKYFQTHFAHFRPTITSLTLTQPVTPCGQILQFALQFPMLQNLCLEWLMCADITSNPAALTVAHQSPPLGGHLRLAGVDTVANWPVGFIHEHPNGINFHSVELEDFSGDGAQHILDMCLHTLQSLAIVPHSTGTN